MKNIQFLLIFVFAINLNSVVAQSIKPKFKKIEYADYEIENNKVVVNSYYSINENGVVQFQNKLYTGIEYSTQQLSSEQVNILNQIFNGEKLLSEYMTTKELEPGSHYAGSNSYLSYTSLDGKKDSLCYIELFMSENFNNLFGKIGNKIYWSEKKTKINKPKYNIEFISGEILKQHIKSKYLPKKELPPKMK